MGRRLPYTPNGKIRQSLRVLWLRSRERSQALRNTNYTCCYCGRKQSKAKGRDPDKTVAALAVHHLDGCRWDAAIDAIRKHILQTPERLAPACQECHDKIHAEEQEQEAE